MPQPPQPPGDQITIRGSLNFVYYAALVHARCITPFLRNQVGENNRLLTFLAFIVLLVYAANDPRINGLVVLWVIGVLVEKYDTHRRRKRGELIHSYYSGTPLVCMVIPGITERTAKLLIEPLIFLVLGFLMLNDHGWEIFGRLFVNTGVALIIVELFDRRVQEQREQAVVDARIEVQALNQRVRERLGGYR
ncbi:MAG TPA: hypothetical protein VG826_05520 [Pirellulales bacterium]|nr:hypothetical protein [Pirellulales bacterium]